jgi:Cft2 family RNA processing exonuclease
MRIVLHGGFGEKGRTCVAVESRGFRLLLDAGVKTSARGTVDYEPRIADDEIAATDAIVVTHGHEDHAAALGWCLERGFRGPVYMTPATRRDAELALADYGGPGHVARLRAADVRPLAVGTGIAIGPLQVVAGRSGHVEGGVWCAVDDSRVRFLYCGDVVPASSVFRMDPVPACDVAALDASYGDDATPSSARAAQVRDWIRRHPQGCALPTPLYGRSLELLAILPAPVALAPGMRDALAAQLRDRSWLLEQAGDVLARRLAEASDWHEGEPLPRAALICHDGMGMAGPARTILEACVRTGQPALFTGHLPERTLAHDMAQRGNGAWIRLPTHPTLPENLAIAATSRASVLLGHSCERAVLAGLAKHLPALRTDAATGDRLEF